MKYKVIRTDDNGNVFLVKTNLTHDEAHALVNQLTDKGHKQVYEIKPTTK